MGLSRRQFTQEFKRAAIQRLEMGASVAEVARAFEVNPNVLLEWSPFLRQTVKTQNSANGMKMPSKGGLSHGFVSTAVYEGVQAGRDTAAGDGGVDGGGGAGF